MYLTEEELFEWPSRPNPFPLFLLLPFISCYYAVFSTYLPINATLHFVCNAKPPNKTRGMPRHHFNYNFVGASLDHD